MPASLLIVEDEKNTREGLRLTFEENYSVHTARDAHEGLQLMDQFDFDIILTDLRMAGKSGMTILEHAQTQAHIPTCIMMTAYGDVETAVEAMKHGAYDFLTKPVNLNKLELVVERALQTRQLKDENQQLHARLGEKFAFSGIIGKSDELQSALEETKRVATSKATVLLHGETGTGKELFAHIIHQNSDRANKPFIPVHCAALPANLLESELFGHEKGAFTGADKDRTGRFEAAHTGTLFLDEIGEIDLPTQVKLLRFLETKSFERVGASTPTHVDIRLICATNRDLPAMVAAGEFREDLLYRLNTITITLPPLRKRPADITHLLDHYIKEFSDENSLTPPAITKDTLQILKKYPWPGNIRELKNFCEHATIMHPGETLSPELLQAKFIQKHPTSAQLSEKDRIAQALKDAKGNKSKAAQILEISRRTLYRKLEQWPDLENS